MLDVGLREVHVLLNQIQKKKMIFLDFTLTPSSPGSSLEHFLLAVQKDGGQEPLTPETADA